MWPYRKQHLRIKSCTKKNTRTYDTGAVIALRTLNAVARQVADTTAGVAIRTEAVGIVSRTEIIYLTKSSGFHHRRSRSFLQHRRQRRGRSERCGPPFRTCSTLYQLRRRILLQQRHQHQGSRETTAKRIFNSYSGGSAMEERTM
jgi:hypothetical protein